MRIVIDYRPALRARTGVGEYIHQTAAALARTAHDDLTLFSSSWKDRVPLSVSAEVPRCRIVDRRIPVTALNLLWHRSQWPPIETLTGATYDIAHSPHPLLLPSRLAAQIVTIHDLHFLTHPERTSNEIRRDYPSLTRSHAHLAHRIIVSSKFAAGEVVRLLDVRRTKIALCPAGAPPWQAPSAPGCGGAYVLFLGGMEPRKNVRGLLDGYARALSRSPSMIPLVLAGLPGPESAAISAMAAEAPLAGRVELRGYVPESSRETLLKGAAAFVLPSFEEGFGLTLLEAMAAGVPVIASDRGSIPEVVGDAGLLIDPEDPESLASALTKLLEDEHLRSACARRGLQRAAQFTWANTARAVRAAYEEALADAHRH